MIHSLRRSWEKLRAMVQAERKSGNKREKRRKEKILKAKKIDEERSILENDLVVKPHTDEQVFLDKLLFARVYAEKLARFSWQGAWLKS